MSETLTTDEAARLVAEARRWEGSLRQRTEGITWMVWGIATAAMFLSYDWMGRGHAPAWVFAVLWIPWVLAGNLTSYALWRSAALTQDPEVAPLGTRRHLGLIVLFVVVFALMAFVLRPTSWSVPMVVAGILWASLGLVIPRMSPRGKVVSAAVGLGVVAAALALSLLPLPESWAGTLAVLVIGTFALGGGFWQTLRA
jgi:hypothetical protein